MREIRPAKVEKPIESPEPSGDAETETPGTDAAA